MNTTYPSDLSDTEWKCLQHHLRESRSDCRMQRRCHTQLGMLECS